MTFHAEEKLNIQHKPLPHPHFKNKKKKKGKEKKTSFPSKEIMFALFFCNASQDMHKQEK